MTVAWFGFTLKTISSYDEKSGQNNQLTLFSRFILNPKYTMTSHYSQLKKRHSLMIF